jgi:hypothetical protein
MTAAMGWQVQIGMDPASVTPTEQYEGLITGLDVNEDLLDAAGLRGTRSRISERVVQNTRAPRIAFTMRPNSVELDLLLPRILGAAEVTDLFALAETLPSFTMNTDLGQQRWLWTGCKVSKATFSSSQGGPLNLELEIEALEVATTATAFPALSVSAVSPYIHSQLTASVGGTGYSYRDVKVAIDNMLDTGRFFNSQTRVSLQAKDRQVAWELNGPYGDNSGNYALPVAGIAVLATWVLGGRSLQFSSSAVQFPRKPPVVSGREEIMLPLTGIARKVGSTLELVTTNDSTP